MTPTLPAIGPAPAATRPATSGIAHVRLLSLNDFHGQLGDSDAQVDGVDIGGAATLAAYVARERAQNPAGTVLVSAGDQVGAAPPESSLLRHHPTMVVLAAMGVDVATFGNHEFDGGYAEAMRIIFGDGVVTAAKAAQGIATATPTRARRRTGRGGAAGAAGGAAARTAAAKRGAWPGSSFPWVSANVVHAKTGKTVLPPYAIKVVDGVKVAFIGATTKDLKNVTAAAGIPNIEALDPATAINRYIPEIQAQGVKAIVVVVHEGGDVDAEAGPESGGLKGAVVQLAKDLDVEVDAIVSGHSHKEYATTVAGKQVVQAGNYAKALGVIELDVDRSTGQVVEGRSRLVRNDEHGIVPDAKVGKLVAGFERQVAPRTKRVVTTLPGAIDRKASPAGESALGSLIADAQRAKAGADIGFMNPGGIRGDLKAGPVTWGELFSIQPFANLVTRVEMTGAEVRAVLEEQFTEARTKVLQASGIVVHLDATKPIGSRVVSVTMADGTPMDPAKTYTVSANGFLLDGGDAFTKFAVGRKRTEFGTDLDALVAYLAGGAKPATAPTGRIVLDAGELPTHGH